MPDSRHTAAMSTPPVGDDPLVDHLLGEDRDEHTAAGADEGEQRS